MAIGWKCSEKHVRRILDFCLWCAKVKATWGPERKRIHAEKASALPRDCLNILNCSFGRKSHCDEVSDEKL